ncbi:hypothetical protein [Leeuwenhoekiella sp. W20_SRS_FM14]|uniref:hypothetical protein n=1 Tax=Leeuwenhoekiella sp. W20_SRS_FM14 TaxID=3240270 RepID=UPI003F946310
MKDLLKQINRDIKILNDQIEKNSNELKRYKDSPEFKTEQDLLKRQEFDNTIDEFQAKSFLVIPSVIGDSGNRPLSSYVRGSSVGIKISDPAGTIQHTIKANHTYIIETELINKGDLYLSSINVDFFCSPKYKESEVLFEITSISFLFNTPIVKGILKKGSISIGDHLKIITESHSIYTQLTGISIPNGTNHTVSSDSQIISLFLDTDKLKNELKSLVSPGDRIVEAPDYNSEQRMFRFRVEDVFSITGRGTIVTGLVEQGTFTLNQKLNLFTGTRSGERSRNRLGLNATSITLMRQTVTNIKTGDRVGLLFKGLDKALFRKGDILVKQSREDFTATIKTTEAPLSVQNNEFLGSRTTYCHGFDTTITSLKWTAPPHKDRSEYIFTARAYAAFPTDMPQDFDALSPELDRHVASKKVEWSV